MRVWKNRRDIHLFVVAVGFAFSHFWLATHFARLSWLTLLGLWPLYLFLFWWNASPVAHNFMHTPWFGARGLNRAFAIFHSVHLGMPQVLYRFHHLNHHRYENDRGGPGGHTRDRSSLYAYGKDGEQEHALPYIALGFFRPYISRAYRDAVSKGHRTHFWLEVLATVVVFAAYAAISWQYVLLFYLPLYYFGWTVTSAENYYEHAGVPPEDPLSNSISYYGKVYNFLFCNEGYHQEHHVRPQCHWSERPLLRARLPGRHPISSLPPALRFADTAPVSILAARPR